MKKSLLSLVLLAGLLLSGAEKQFELNGEHGLQALIGGTLKSPVKAENVKLVPGMENGESGLHPVGRIAGLFPGRNRKAAGGRHRRFLAEARHPHGGGSELFRSRPPSRRFHREHRRRLSGSSFLRSSVRSRPHFQKPCLCAGNRRKCRILQADVSREMALLRLHLERKNKKDRFSYRLQLFGTGKTEISNWHRSAKSLPSVPRTANRD